MKRQRHEAIGVLLAIVAVSLPAIAETPLLVTGSILTAEGHPIPGVVVTLVGTTFRAVTDTYGAFHLHGRATGDSRTRLQLRLPDGTLRQKTVNLTKVPAVVDWVVDFPLFADQLSVRGGASARSEGGRRLDAAELEFLDIVSTPGTRADPTFAAQMLPGVVKADEGSGLYIRGGEASETATYFSSALIAHPYRHETPTGGFFGTFSAFQTRGLSLSTGAFPARFGGAMSGLLELEPLPPPHSSGGALHVGLQGISLALERPVGTGTGSGVRVAGSWSDASALTSVSSRSSTFSDAPESADFSLAYDRPTARGSLSLVTLWQQSRVGAKIEETNFAGNLTNAQRNTVAILRWDRSFGSWESAFVLSPYETSSAVEVGVLDIDLADRGVHSRLDLARSLGRWSLRGGLEWNTGQHDSTGFLPEIGGDFGGDGGVRLWRDELRPGRTGGYVEADYRRGRLAAQVGVRADRYREPVESSLEPRVDLGWRLAPGHRLRLAWGIFRQAPEPDYIADGARLSLMEARTWVLGYRYGDPGDPLELRVEAYDRDYAELPLENAPGEAFSSAGSGFARGFDFFLRANRDPWSGWVSYSYLDTERLYTAWQDRGRFESQESPSPPDFAIPHTLQLVVHRTLPADFEAGLAVRAASGAPFTAVVGSVSTPDGYIPVYGARNSQRLPTFWRVDLSLSRRFLVADRHAGIAYFGVENLFNRLNVFDYAYNDDFSRRRPARSGLGRSLYLGVSLLWGGSPEQEVQQ